MSDLVDFLREKTTMELKKNPFRGRIIISRKMGEDAYHKNMTNLINYLNENRYKFDVRLTMNSAVFSYQLKGLSVKNA